MLMDYLENGLQLIITIVMQILCLFHYINHRRRGYIYLLTFFLCYLVSNYHWSAYQLIMKTTPVISDFLSYLGWNIAFATLLGLVLHMRPPEQRRYFHPLMLLPIPLNIWQLTLYLPYGGVANSIYQVLVVTCIAVFSLQGVCYWLKNRKNGAKPPYVAIGGLVFAACEFGMWTSSCFAWPSPYLHMYYYSSFACSFDFIFLEWAVNKAYGVNNKLEPGRAKDSRESLLKTAYLLMVLICCLGGIGLGFWMRKMLVDGTRGMAESSVYNIISVVLFMCSMIVVAVSVVIIFWVRFGQKAAESDALREAKDVAEQSNASKSEFLANMSHEIRTPINAILGMNEIILRESLEARDMTPAGHTAMRRVFDDICASSGNIDSAGKNLLSIVNDILDISKIEAGKMEIAESPYKLSSVLNDVSNMIVYKARTKQLEFHVEVDEALSDGLSGDEARVRQVLTNLLNNAVKYTDSGSVRLAIRAAADKPAEPGSTIRLVITVQDTGIGIRQEDIDRLFDKFERVDMDRNSTIEGTGLGLAITRRLLLLMGGSIDVASEYGKGSTFTAVIPQKVVSCEHVGNFREKFERSIEASRARRESFHAPDARILVVDDTRMNIAVVTGLLKNTEIMIDTAENGAEAVAHARKTKYDLILMDQRMPGMDGTEALGRIRQESLNRETPVICVTADAISGAREKYMAAGFTDYLTKPINGDSLEKALLAYLPAERVEWLHNEMPETGSSPAVARDNTWKPLRAAGIDPEIGLGYCQGDDGFYRSMLLEFAGSAPEKARLLQESCAARDWENYGIYVHALKSASKMIGATGLSEAAQRLETAAGDGLGAVIELGHAPLLAEYAAVAEAILRLPGTAVDAAPAPKAEEDDGILEFLPEED